MAFLLQNCVKYMKLSPVASTIRQARLFSLQKPQGAFTNISKNDVRLALNEFKATSQLLERSGVTRSNQILLVRRSIQTSSTNKNDGDKESGKNNKDDDEDEAKRIIQGRLVSFVIGFYLLALLVFIMSPGSSPPEMAVDVSWTEFVHQMLAKGEVSQLVVRPDLKMVFINLHSGSVIRGSFMHPKSYVLKITDVHQFEEKLREAEDSLGIRPGHGVPVTYQRVNDIPTSLLLTALGLVLLFYFFKSGGAKITNSSMFQMGKAKFTMIDPLMPGSGKGVKFSDVAGSHEAKTEVREFVDFLKNPGKYQRLGAKIPKGALLLGPPGCGKTLLAKAVATEGHVPFLAMNGPEFIEMIGGLGAARVRDLFNEAKKRSPCIIYIDEIDAIGRKRSSGGALDGTSQEGEQTLNQLLVEMDGLLTKQGVVVLSSTNRMDILDKALLRPGRFDRHIIMDLPTLEERREIFEHHLKSIILEKPVSYYARRMASLTLGFSGADIANVCNEAALYAARMGKTAVSGSDLEYSVERVVGGTEKRTQVLTKDEKRVVAYHEAGHALLGWLLEHTDALLKVTIVPRTNHALGFAQYAPKEQKLYSKEEIFEKMCMALGGRVAESLTFNRITTGAQNDLDKVTKMAYAQVRNFGFSDKVGLISFPESEEGGKRPYSKLLANTIDDEANKMIFAAYKKTEEILSENKDKLKMLAETLLQKETLNYEDVLAVLGEPQFDKSYVEPAQFESEMNTWKDMGK